MLRDNILNHRNFVKIWNGVLPLTKTVNQINIKQNNKESLGNKCYV